MLEDLGYLMLFFAAVGAAVVATGQAAEGALTATALLAGAGYLMVRRG